MLVDSLAVRGTCPRATAGGGNYFSDGISDFGGLRIDDAQAAAKAFDAQHGFGEAGGFTARERTYRRSRPRPPRRLSG
jgi:hypothetical protein